MRPVFALAALFLATSLAGAALAQADRYGPAPGVIAPEPPSADLARPHHRRIAVFVPATTDAPAPPPALAAASPPATPIDSAPPPPAAPPAPAALIAPPAAPTIAAAQVVAQNDPPASSGGSSGPQVGADAADDHTDGYYDNDDSNPANQGDARQGAAD